MKRQIDENDRQLRVNKMINVRRRIYADLYVFSWNGKINQNKNILLIKRKATEIVFSK
jgi:hypothetical protein